QLSGCTDRGDRNVCFRCLGHGDSVCIVSLSAVECNPVVRRINFYQHCSGLHVLVVLNVELDYVAANPGANGIDMSVDLGVVSGFIAGGVAPRDNSAHNEHQGADQEAKPDAGVTQGGAAAFAEVTSRDWSRFWLVTFGLWLSDGLNSGIHDYLPLKYCLTPSSANPIAVANSTLARL